MDATERLRFGPSRVDLRRRVVTCGDRREGLTELEARLLRYLVERRGQLVSREQLLVEVWGYAPEVQTRAVDTAIRRLRGKVEPDPRNPIVIQTVYGEGYRMPLATEPPEPGPDDADAPTALPETVGAFFGREAPLARLDQALAEGRRLVTVVGTAGVGKTRLVLEHLRQGTAGVETWFCDLSACRAVDEARAQLARTLRVPPGTGSLDARIQAQLASTGPALLVLDNLEQLLPEVRPFVESLLDAGPDLQLLVTSRSPTDSLAEHLLALSPLPAPPPSDSDPGPAVALYLERATLARGRGALPERWQADARPLVAALDGLPLAIELAASRARHLSPNDLLRHLERRFRVLVRPQAGGPDRQSTLRRAFDWSWALLSRDEQIALTRLSVFEGGFSLERAEALLDLEAPVHDLWAPELIARLVDQSLVRPPDPSGRYRLLVSVQAYALERLEDPEAIPGATGPDARLEVEERHARLFAAAAGPLFQPGASEVEEVARREGLFDDLGNLRAALRRSTAGGWSEHAGPLASAMGAISWQLGLFEEFQRISDALQRTPGLPEVAKVVVLFWAAVGERSARGCSGSTDALAAAVEPEAPALPEALRGRALRLLATVYRERGDDQAAVLAARRAVALLEPLSPCPELSMAWCSLGLALSDIGDLAAAEGALESAGRVARGTGLSAQLSVSFMHLALARHAAGQLHGAATSFVRALDLAEHPRMRGLIRMNFGSLRWDMGDLEAASRLYQEARERALEDGFPRLAAQVLANWGEMMLSYGHLDEARDMLTRAIAELEATDLRRWAVWFLLRLAELEMQEGNLAEATVAFQSARRRLGAHHDPKIEADFDATWGLLLTLQGRLDEAHVHMDTAVIVARGRVEPLSSARVLCLAADQRRVAGEPEASRALAERALALTDALPLRPEAPVRRMARQVLDALGQDRYGPPLVLWSTEVTAPKLPALQVLTGA
ncbi:MAG: winged helix-turn-helix domain-containing protein [Alphaproteobacteria bacterium]|nr:winged helix-turn-helix domain-containing protein [Alphaproteobacteria bacterium]